MTLPRIVVTLGDPCGIGPELLLRTLPRLASRADLVVAGARAGVDLLAGGPVPFAWEGDRLATGGCSVPWIDPTPHITPRDLVLGQGGAASGLAAVEGVRAGALRVQGGLGDALVTLPLSKAAAHAAGFPIPGHTEFLQGLAGSPLTRMAFASPGLCVVLHTVHQSLRSVVEGLDEAAVAETLSFAADRFAQFAGRPGLRVALCALNPHAGEGGAFGHEEAILERALDRARAACAEGAWAHVPSPFPPGPAPAGWELYPGRPARGGGVPEFSGPHPADTVFLRAWRGEFDLVVALYHDQGLIPVKVLEPETAVNLTLGLPYVRTSPDHGTAFAIAGRWQADPANFLQAADLAIRLAARARGGA
ncbi:PdxA family dehydrogenase [Mesoterricola silvestris]|uniref:4-hydroxythreonine-4-phosphate dehydrogenase n=1 Tax=Mesoterricola silvestris TaxID=2927979 RepID=A0AA48GVY4_9BACT|nr:4-hydroxythreonine-4-phosphate dehydrogenase PdxA [Mesoterricola silvestris]BDU72826.1 4-hydroxythreonine-4-phosphate dehydrogenase [Mesoterricola silvestris]